MVYILPGQIFSTGDELTHLGLHTMVDAAVATSVTAGEFSASSKLIQPLATAPGGTPAEGDVWFDTTLGLWRTRNDDRWDARGCDGRDIGLDRMETGPNLENDTGVLMPAYSVVAIVADSKMKLADFTGSPENIGILQATVPDGSTGLVRLVGVMPVRVRGPIPRSNPIQSSGTYTGQAVAITATDFTAGIDIGIALYDLPASISTLMTCIIWR